MVDKNENSQCTGSYEVSGYTTKDGKVVDSYIRQCWKHGGGGVAGEWLNSAVDILAKVPTADKQIFQQNYQNFPLSTFDVKKTEENIKNSIKYTENILKQKMITTEDITNINNRTQIVMHNLFDDIEDLSDLKSNLPKIPTIESSEKAQKIESDRKQIRENAYQTILMLCKQINVIEKQWKKVSTKDDDYDNKFNQYIANKQEIEKLSDTAKDLFDYASKIDDTTVGKVKKLREEIGMMRFRPMLPKKQVGQQQKWIWPCEGSITSGYGKRKAPVPGASEFHNGWDIGVSEGTPIKAIADGKVIAVGEANNYGNWVVIAHGTINGVNVTSEYGHISSWNVKYGQMVKQGDVIAKSGNSGRSSGAHLHITIREGKFPGTAVNPKKYIKNHF